MALYSLYCAEVPLRNCSLTHSRNLSVLYDAILSMRERLAFVADLLIRYHPRRLTRLRSVSQQFCCDVTTEVSALLLLRLDYCNAVLAGPSAAIPAPLPVTR